MKRIPKRRCGLCKRYDVKDPLMDDELPWGYCFVAPPRDGTNIRPIVNHTDRCAQWDVRTDEMWEPPS